MKALVGVIMGSKSDWDTMSAATELLDRLSVPYEVRVVSAHRTPDLVFEYASTARQRGLEVIIAGAGGAAHLPGMTAAKTSLPVLGVPVQSKTLSGLDSLLSIVQMPAGVPVATFSIGRAGAANAALSAASILSIKHVEIGAALDAFRKQQTEDVLQHPDPPNPGMTIGIVGAGQLGRMMALAGYPLGLDCLFLDPAQGAPAGQVAPQLCGEFTDGELLARLARDTEVLTFDWENISVDALRRLPKGTRICPPVKALAAAQDRVSEKQLFERLKIPTTRWRAVDSNADLSRAVAQIGLPGVLKTRRLGYDGKGQHVLRKPADVQVAWDALGGAPLLYEELVPFDYEVSIIGARSRRGEVAIYPLNGNMHAQGILRLTRAPYGPAPLQRRAALYLRRALDHFRYTGILTIEFFVRRGRLIANEMAPRVHNSGHWTIEGAQTSQFENHLRAILGLPLGSTRALGHSAMINLIGEMPAKAAILGMEGVHLHDYVKAPRPGRKLGHLTLVARTAALRDRRARGLLAGLAPAIRIP